LPKKFKIGTLDFKQASCFLLENDIQLDTGFRNIFDRILQAHCAGYEGVLKELWSNAEGITEYWHNLNQEALASCVEGMVMCLPSSYSFSSYWEIPLGYFSSGLDNLFVDFWTNGPATRVALLSLDPGHYQAYRERLKAKEG